MKVEILITDNRVAKEYESMGIDKAPPMSYTEFWFRDELLESFWVDHEDKEIVFSIGGDDYRTPYTVEKLNKFKAIV